MGRSTQHTATAIIALIGSAIALAAGIVALTIPNERRSISILVILYWDTGPPRNRAIGATKPPDVLYRCCCSGIRNVVGCFVQWEPRQGSFWS